MSAAAAPARSAGAAARRHLALFLCWACAGFLFLYGGGQPAAFLFAALTLLNGYALAARLALARGAEVRRQVEAGVVEEGQTVLVTTELTLARSPWLPFGRWLPLMWVAVEETWTRNGTEHRVVRRLFPGRAGRTIRFSYELKDLPRGVYCSSDVEAVAGDVFGFAARKLKVVERTDPDDLRPLYAARGEERKEALRFAVWPKPDKEIGVLRLPVRLKDWQEGTDWAGIREYRPGDKLARIHWKSSARGTGLKTKRFEADERRPQVVIALDPGIGDREIHEKAVRICAGLLRLMDSQGVEAALIDAHGPYSRLMDKLAASEPGSGKRLHEALPGGSRSSIVCVAEQLDPPLIDALHRLRKRRIPVLLIQLLKNGQDRLRDRRARAALRESGCEVHALPVKTAQGQSTPGPTAHGQTGA
jgi:hypothetical protein